MYCFCLPVCDFQLSFFLLIFFLILTVKHHMEQAPAACNFWDVRQYCTVKKSLHSSQVAHQDGAYPSFHSMKRLGVFLLPQDGMLVYCRVTPSIKFAGTHLYTWVVRGTMKVRCFTHEHNTVPWLGLKPGLPDPESSTLTIRPRETETLIWQLSIDHKMDLLHQILQSFRYKLHP